MLDWIRKILRRFMFEDNDEDGLEEDGDDYEDDDPTPYRIIAMESRNDMECKEPIVEVLKRHMSEVINIRRLSVGKKTEVTEYLKWAVFALGGSITAVDDNTFLITPADILSMGTDDD